MNHSLKFTLINSELRRIKEALKLCNGNRAKAAIMLNMSERSLYRKIKTYRLIVPRSRSGRKPKLKYQKLSIRFINHGWRICLDQKPVIGMMYRQKTSAIRWAAYNAKSVEVYNRENGLEYRLSLKH